MHSTTLASESSASVATIQAYSEWRPTRWRLTTSTGKSYGLFNTHERAARFAEGVLMGLDASDYVSIKVVRSASYNTWLGDDIGCSSGKRARIHLCDQFGRQQETSVRNVLLQAANMDAYGLGRVVSALRFFASTGELHADDLAVWREVEADFPIRELFGRNL
jgi:hypothetical protein